MEAFSKTKKKSTLFVARDEYALLFHEDRKEMLLTPNRSVADKVGILLMLGAPPSADLVAMLARARDCVKLGMEKNPTYMYRKQTNEYDICLYGLDTTILLQY